jgi:hypothetical protein
LRSRRSLLETLEPQQMMAVQVNNLHLLTDTGSSSTDLVTSDPRLTGSVTWDGHGGHVDLQFDHQGDGVPDGYAGTWSSGSSFTYNPRDNGLATSNPGQLPLKCRTAQYDG